VPAQLMHSTVMLVPTLVCVFVVCLVLPSCCTAGRETWVQLYVNSSDDEVACLFLRTLFPQVGEVLFNPSLLGPAAALYGPQEAEAVADAAASCPGLPQVIAECVGSAMDLMNKRAGGGLGCRCR
jgi:hypothetical protein